MAVAASTQVVVNGDALRPVSMDFHALNLVDVGMGENEKVSWDVRRVSSP
jgi:hypothetical protein